MPFQNQNETLAVRLEGGRATISSACASRLFVAAIPVALFLSTWTLRATLLKRRLPVCRPLYPRLWRRTGSTCRLTSARCRISYQTEPCFPAEMNKVDEGIRMSHLFARLPQSLHWPESQHTHRERSAIEVAQVLSHVSNWSARIISIWAQPIDVVAAATEALGSKSSGRVRLHVRDVLV